ncbi:MAG TPA: hypothetical protein PLD88_13625 [Candidatus Berkiella sp.]|nr:hypothetical protein [Candidatus Berkiella sp.]
MPSLAKALPIAHITHTDTPPYEIIIIDGMPFYQSSGNASFANTWFPFFGILEKNMGSAYPAGSFHKAPSIELPHHVAQYIHQLFFPSYAGELLTLRFWRLPCLLLSSTLGGGLWESNTGHELKIFLQQQYPAYYQAEPRLTIKPATARLQEPAAVNRWLCRQANVKNINALASKYPKTANDLISLLQPVRRQVKIAELDTLNGERLFESRDALKRKAHRAAPKRQDKEKPLKRFFKKNPELDPASSANRLSRFTYAIMALCFIAMGLCMSPWHLMGFYVMCFAGVALLGEKIYQSRQETQTPLAPPSLAVTSIEKNLPTLKPLKATVPNSSIAKATINQEPAKSILKKRL